VNWKGNKINGRTRHESIVTVAPGVRAAWNQQDSQLVLGLAAPIVRTTTQTHLGVYAYASYELPFRK
jgi:hypothetical protein